MTALTHEGNIKSTFVKDEDRRPYLIMFIHNINDNILNSSSLVLRVFKKNTRTITRYK